MHTPTAEQASTVEDTTASELARNTDEQIAKAQAAIATEVQRLEGLIAVARTYTAEQDIAEEFCRAFPPTEPGYCGQMRASIGVGPHVLNGLLIAWDARRLADVTPRVAWLAQRLGKFTIDDSPEMGRRTYDWGRLKLMVFFNSYDDKTVCKFVEVGTEPKPIYKLMCEDAGQ